MVPFGRCCGGGGGRVIEVDAAGGGVSGKRGENGDGGRARREDLKGLAGWIVRFAGILIVVDLCRSLQSSVDLMWDEDRLRLSR